MAFWGYKGILEIVPEIKESQSRKQGRNVAKYCIDMLSALR